MMTLLLLSTVSFLVSVEARPAVEDFVRRQNNNGYEAVHSIG
jgi:hypothetical protein